MLFDGGTSHFIVIMFNLYCLVIFFTLLLFRPPPAVACDRGRGAGGGQVCSVLLRLILSAFFSGYGNSCCYSIFSTSDCQPQAWQVDKSGNMEIAISLIITFYFYLLLLFFSIQCYRSPKEALLLFFFLNVFNKYTFIEKIGTFIEKIVTFIETYLTSQIFFESLQRNY